MGSCVEGKPKGVGCFPARGGGNFNKDGNDIVVGEDIDNNNNVDGDNKEYDDKEDNDNDNLFF